MNETWVLIVAATAFMILPVSLLGLAAIVGMVEKPEPHEAHGDVAHYPRSLSNVRRANASGV
jgi:hypothetical protein